MRLSLEIVNDLEDWQLDTTLLETLHHLLELFGQAESVDTGTVVLSFVDDASIHELNLSYRGIDSPTDVLSFSMKEMVDEEPSILYEDLEETEGYDGDLGSEFGDIIISVPRAIEQAQEYNHSIDREIGFLFVHGLLHLIGYDHGNEMEETQMITKQEFILSKAGLIR